MKCSFLLSTYNKLETLTEVLDLFRKNRIPNTELVVADGFSTDGTIDYLKKLKEEGVIDVLILSEEKDLGEWHGYKKALDASSGEYIKFLTDDDAFNYEAIKECLNFLSENSNVDWLNSQGFSRQYGTMYYSGYHEIMKNKNSTKPSLNGLTDGICGLGFFIKRSITKNLDLLNNNYGARTDKQLSLALTESNFVGSTTNIQTWVRVLNRKSNTVLYGGALEQENIVHVNKEFKIDEIAFRNELNMCIDHLTNTNNTITKEFLIF